MSLKNGSLLCDDWRCIVTGRKIQQTFENWHLVLQGMVNKIRPKKWQNFHPGLWTFGCSKVKKKDKMTTLKCLLNFSTHYRIYIVHWHCSLCNNIQWSMLYIGNYWYGKSEGSRGVSYWAHSSGTRHFLHISSWFSTDNYGGIILLHICNFVLFFAFVPSLTCTQTSLQSIEVITCCYYSYN